jgi:hypothetical protein
MTFSNAETSSATGGKLQSETKDRKKCGQRLKSITTLLLRRDKREVELFVYQALPAVTGG